MYIARAAGDDSVSAIHSDDHLKPIFSRGPVLALKFLILAAISAGLMMYDQRVGESNPVRDTVSVAMYPVRTLAEIPREIYDLGVHFAAREKLIEQNESLRHEHLRLNARLQKLVVLEAENQRIRDLLESSKQIHNAVMIAEILSASLDPYRQLIRINKGSRHGIQSGQALIDAHGILGQVIEVTPFTATAVLVTDENQGIPVEINRNGLQTVAHGGGEGMELKLPFLPSNADVQLGDLLVSSGLGGRYPAGYPVARVTAVQHHPGEHFLEISAAPAAQIMRGREILLVRQGEATESTARLLDPAALPDRVAIAD